MNHDDNDWLLILLMNTYLLDPFSTCDQYRPGYHQLSTISVFILLLVSTLL